MAGGEAAAGSFSGTFPQQAISWNLLAYLLTLAVLLLQQVGLLYYLGLYALPLLVVGLYDVLLLLLFLANNNAEFAALKGGSCWVLYVWGLTIKLLLFFFVVFRGNNLAATAADGENSSQASSDNESIQAMSGEFVMPGFLFRHPRGSVVEVSLLLLIAGSAVYALLVFRATEQLVGGVASQLSTEGMLLTDCVAHVVLDFIDAAAAFFTYSTCPAAINEQTTWLRVLVGIVLALAVFLHAYSFPSSGGLRLPLPQQQQQLPQQQTLALQLQQREGGDIFMTRKHAALVGICVVDLPLACLRLFTWAYYPTYEGFSPFLFKNICFIPIQFARIRHASLAARLKARRQPKYELYSLQQSQETHRALAAAERQQQLELHNLAAAAAAAASTNALQFVRPPSLHAQDEDATTAAEKETLAATADAAGPMCTTGAEGATPRRGGDAKETRGRVGDGQKGWKASIVEWMCCCCKKRRGVSLASKALSSKAETVSKGRRGEGVNEQETAAADVNAFSPPFAESSTDEKLDFNEPALVRLADLWTRAVQKNRTLPVAGFSLKRVIQRIYFSKFGGRHAIAPFLDTTLRSSFWKEIRIAFPVMNTWTCQIAIVTCLFYFYNHRHSFPLQLFSLEAMEDASDWVWNRLPVEVQVTLIITCGHFFINCCCWILAAPLLDVIGVCIFASLRLFSFFLLVLSFRDFNVFGDLFNIHFHVKDVAKYALFVFVLEPIVGVLSTLYPVLCVLLGREYITYIVQPARTNSSSRGGHQSVFDATSAAAAAEGDFSTALETQPRGDEAGVVATISLMVFLNCRYMLAPFSINQLLMSSNMIKAIRLNDGLIRVHWRQTLMVLLLRVWCFLLYVNFPQSVTYGKYPAVIAEASQNYKVRDKFWFSRFSFASLVFLAHVLLMLVYMVFSQAVRLQTLERFENKAVFKDLALLWTQIQEDRLYTLAALVAGGERAGQQQQLLRSTAQRQEVEEVVEKYYVHCFHTWPGDIIPMFF